MAAAAWYEWLVRVAGALIIALGIGMAIWSLRGDRSRGRRRCPKCWYDMSAAAAAPADDGTEQFTCPECGRRIVGATGLLRPRRFWRRAACFLLLPCLGWQMCLIGTPGREGLTAFVPTVVLIAFDSDLLVAQANVRPVHSRLAFGVVLPWDNWLASMRELHTPEFLPDKMVLRRQQWPIDRPVRVQIGDACRFQSTFEWRSITMWSPLDETQIAEWDMSPNFVLANYTKWPPNFLALPPPVPGPNRYELVVQIGGEHGGWRTERVVIAVEGVAHITDVVAPDSSDSISREILNNLDWGIHYSGNQSYVSISMRDRWFASQRHVWYAFHARLYRGERLIGEAAADSPWWRSVGISYWQWRPFETEDVPGPFDLDDVWLELTPAPLAALPEFHTTHYWAGSLRVRLRDLPMVESSHPSNILRDASAVQRVPGDPQEYQTFIASLPLYTPREIPLLPATGGTLEVPPNHDDQ